MRRWPIVLLLLSLAGCVSDPGPDLDDGPYGQAGFDGGGYYAPPREFDYDVEQRAVETRTYHYPSAYPYYYGGYGGRRYYRHRPDYDRDRHDARGGRDVRRENDHRERQRGERSPIAPPRNANDRTPERVLQGGPHGGRTGPTVSPGRSGSPARSGGPHGGRTR